MRLTEKKITALRQSVRARPVRAIMLLVSLCIVFCYGVGVGFYQWPPFSVLKAGHVAIKTKLGKYQPLPKSEGASFTLSTSRYSYFALDTTGSLALEKSLPYRSEGMYRFVRTIDPGKTAVIVMDPWVDMASDHANEYYGEILNSRIIPLVRHTLHYGLPIIVLTNNPKGRNYNSKIHPELELLFANGKISLLFHQGLDDDGFAEYLRSQGVDSLIYTGFASNMCLISRQTGMIHMKEKGFRIFFVPEASAAVELADTWNEQSIHEASTKIISQWIAEIIDYEELIKALNDR